MKTIIEDSALKLSVKRVSIAIRHPFRLSNEGSFHMPLLSFSVSSSGFGVYVLGFALHIVKEVADVHSGDKEAEFRIKQIKQGLRPQALVGLSFSNSQIDRIKAILESQTSTEEDRISNAEYLKYFVTNRKRGY